MAGYVRTQLLQHPIGPAGRLSLKVSSADIRLRGVPGEGAVVRASFEIEAASDADADEVFQKVRLRASTSREQLTVEEPDGGSPLGGVIDRLIRGRGQVELSLEVELPESAQLRLETVSGEVTAEGLMGEQRYATVSGDLFMTRAGGSLRVNTISGDVTVRADAPVSARCESVSGDLSLSAPRLDNLRAQAVSGDVEVEGELAARGEFRIETVSGDVSVGLLGSATFEVRGLSSDVSSEFDHRIEGSADRRRLVIGEGRPSVVFSSMSGDLSVRRPRRIRPERGQAPMPSRISELDELEILQALELGEIDVDEANRRLTGGDSDA